MSNPEDTDRRKLLPHLYKPGQSGNPSGRPRGARSKLGEKFILALQNDFAQHGVQAIEEMRVADPGAYIRVIAGLLPKEVKIETTDDLTDEQLDARIRQLAGLLRIEIGVGEASRSEEVPERTH